MPTPNSGFCSIKQLRVFLPPLDQTVHRRLHSCVLLRVATSPSPPQEKKRKKITHLCVGVMCLDQEHNSKFPRFEPAPLAPKPSALTMGPARLSHDIHVIYAFFSYLRLSKTTHRFLRPQETTATGNQFLSHLLWRQTTKKRFDNNRETLLRNKKSKIVP